MGVAGSRYASGPYTPLDPILLPPNFSSKSQTLVEDRMLLSELNGLNGEAINVRPKKAMLDKLIYLRMPLQEAT